MDNEQEIINCEHIEKGSAPFRQFFTIGENKHLRVCILCADNIKGKIIADMVEKAIRDGLQAAAISGRVREELVSVFNMVAR